MSDEDERTLMQTLFDQQSRNIKVLFCICAAQSAFIIVLVVLVMIFCRMK